MLPKTCQHTENSTLKKVSRYQTPKVLLIKKGFKGAILQIQDKYLLGEIQGLLNFPVVQTLVQITIFKQ